MNPSLLVYNLGCAAAAVGGWHWLSTARIYARGRGRSPGLVPWALRYPWPNLDLWVQVIRVVESLPCVADDFHFTRSAHGSFADLLREMAQHSDFEVGATVGGQSTSAQLAHKL